MTTIIAHKLSDESQELQVPHVLLNRISFIYLHGKLERMNGYDIFSYLIGHEPERESNGSLVKVHLDKCTVVYAHEFAWTRAGIWHGLIVMMGDDESIKYARKKFHEKSYIL